MSGGVAYVYDEDGGFASRCNTSMVTLGAVVGSAEQEADKAHWHHAQADETILRKLVEDHHKWTGSLRARHILDHWAESRAKFVKVFPKRVQAGARRAGRQGGAGRRRAEGDSGWNTAGRRRSRRRALRQAIQDQDGTREVIRRATPSAHGAVGSRRRH